MKKRILFIIICLTLALCFSSCGNGKDSKNNTKLDGKEELAQGVYVIGEDLPEGKYNFTYKTELSEEKEYYGVDGISIQRAGASESEPKNEPENEDDEDNEDDGDYLFFGGFDYAAAFKGKTSYVNLKKGDRLEVSSSEGIWKAELLK